MTGKTELINIIEHRTVELLKNCPVYRKRSPGLMLQSEKIDIQEQNDFSEIGTDRGTSTVPAQPQVPLGGGPSGSNTARWEQGPSAVEREVATVPTWTPLVRVASAADPVDVPTDIKPNNFIDPKEQDQCKDEKTEMASHMYMKQEMTNGSSSISKTAYMSYHRSDAKAFYDHWKQFRAPRYAGDLWPDNFTTSEQTDMDKEYQVLPEQFCSRNKLPMITPDNVDDFISHMSTFQGVLIPLLLEVCSGASSTSRGSRSSVHCIATY